MGGRLPTQTELAELNTALRAEYTLPPGIIDLIRTFPVDSPPMHALQTAIAAALHDPDADVNEPRHRRKAISAGGEDPRGGRRLRSLPFREGHHRAAPRDGHRLELPLDAQRGGAHRDDGQALDVCLILHADHGTNASTFTSLVIISTLSDMYSSIAGAIGALRGPLHGGANEGVMRMLEEIGDLSKVDEVIERKMATKEKIMGFGHRVYKAYDPRATYLKTFAKGLAEDTGNMELYQMSNRIEEIMNDKVAAKGIFPNVDFYSATTYWSLGLKLDLFTPMFAIARMSGWTGHCMEQLMDNKLIRPGPPTPVRTRSPTSPCRIAERRDSTTKCRSPGGPTVPRRGLLRGTRIACTSTSTTTPPLGRLPRWSPACRTASSGPGQPLQRASHRHGRETVRRPRAVLGRPAGRVRDAGGGLHLRRHRGRESPSAGPSGGSIVPSPDDACSPHWRPNIPRVSDSIRGLSAWVPSRSRLGWTSTAWSTSDRSRNSSSDEARRSPSAR